LKGSITSEDVASKTRALQRMAQRRCYRSRYPHPYPTSWGI